MFGEGTLEVLPDGFGFLRKPRLQLPVSPARTTSTSRPSQIRRFGPEAALSGSHRRRQIRSRTKENEQHYFALLPVEADQLPRAGHASRQKVVFDDLHAAASGKARLRPLRPIAGRAEHASDGPDHPFDRQGPARPDRRPAADRQDRTPAEDGQDAIIHNCTRNATSSCCSSTSGPKK